MRLPPLSIAKLALVVFELRLPAAHLVPGARAFDLDHFGARFRQDQRRQCARQKALKSKILVPLSGANGRSSSLDNGRVAIVRTTG